MPFFTNSTNITMTNITEIVNSIDVGEMIVKGNEIMFGGMGFFLILCTVWVILFLASQEINRDELLVNLMVSSAIVTVASMFFRAMEVYVYGVKVGLLTDRLLWIFPLFSILIGFVLYMTKK